MSEATADSECYPSPEIVGRIVLRVGVVIQPSLPLSEKPQDCPEGCAGCFPSPEIATRALKSIVLRVWENVWSYSPHCLSLKSPKTVQKVVLVVSYKEHHIQPRPESPPTQPTYAFPQPHFILEPPELSRLLPQRAVRALNEGSVGQQPLLLALRVSCALADLSALRSYS